jgi:hypothetical protein
VLARRYRRHLSFITNYALVARGLMESPPNQRVLSEERSARPRPSSTTYVRREDKDAGRAQLFPYSTSETELVLEQEVRFHLAPRSSQLPSHQARAS